MTLEEYQAFTKTTAIYPTGGIAGMDYLILGMAAEAGEVAGKYAKYKRGDYFDNAAKLHEDMDKEIGDILWFISQYCNETETTIGVLMEMNMEKLTSRQERGVLQGDGDNR